MAGTTILTLTLDAVCTVAQNYSGITAARVAKGYRNYADTENYQQTVANLTPKTQAYAAFWLKRATVAQNESFPALIVGEVAMSIAKDVSDDLDAYWDYIYGLAQQLTADGNFTGAVKPSACRFSLHSIDIIRTSGIVIFDFGAYGDGGIDFPDP